MPEARTQSSSAAQVDKKPAVINVVEGRGKSVVADILIPKEIVNKKLDYKR